MLPSYRSQSVDSQSKSTEWFLYDGNIGRSNVNLTIRVTVTNLNFYNIGCLKIGQNTNFY